MTATALAAETPSPDKIREQQSYTLGTAAYLRGFTMNELYRVRSVHVAKPGNAVNRFDHVRVLATPELARRYGVVRANSATLYSLAWLDLSLGPIVLEFPAIADRYFTFNYVDYFQHNENLSNVTIGREGGAYAFVGPKLEGRSSRQDPPRQRRDRHGLDHWPHRSQRAGRRQERQRAARPLQPDVAARMGGRPPERHWRKRISPVARQQGEQPTELLCAAQRRTEAQPAQGPTWSSWACSRP